MRLAISIIFFVAFLMHSSGQIITIRSEFDSDSMMIGEQLKYRIIAESDKDVLVQMPIYSIVHQGTPILLNGST